MTTVDPSRCSKRDIAEMYGLTLKQVDKLVREGAPCEPNGTGIRSPLVFNAPEFFRWYSIRKATEKHGELVGKIIAQDFEIAELKGEWSKYPQKSADESESDF